MYAPKMTRAQQEAHEHNSRRYGVPGFGFPIRTRAEIREERREQERQDREVFSYHEAGHAIAACALGYEGVVIDMSPDDGDAGAQTRYRVPRGWRPERRRERDLCTAYAGAWGEVLGCGGLMSHSGRTRPTPPGSSLKATKGTSSGSGSSRSSTS